MFKKKLLTLACAVFCAAIVTAQTPVSRVNAATAGLIEDGVIDSLDFGNEEGKGVIFGQYQSENGKIELGWGNSLSDTLWLSVYDGYTMNGDETETESLQKKYGQKDGINIDYVDETRNISSGANDWHFGNTLAVGAGINNTFGVQAVWGASYYNYKDRAATFNPTTGKLNIGTSPANIKSESADSSAGTTTSEEYTNIKNYDNYNTIKFNFKGVGIENDGEVPFWAKLNYVASDLDFHGDGNDYSSSTKYLGQTKESVSATGVKETVTISPSVEGEVGFNFKEWGVAKPSLALVENFYISFDIDKYNTSYKTTSNTTASKTTKTVNYEETAGKEIYWTNTLTPKFDLDFDLDEKLTLKTEVSAAVGLTMDNTEAGTYKRTTTNKTLNKATGLYTTNSVTTVEGPISTQNRNSFTTTITPNFKLGLVYQVIPGKTNINFGVNVAPGAYSWEVTETTNANINTVTTTETTDADGNKTTSKDVTVNNQASYTGNAETRTVTTSNGTTTATFNIGATWFFTENAKLDVWYRNGFTSLFSDNNSFGVDFSVMF